MITIPVKTRLDAAGMLNLHVATGLPEADVEVVVIVQPVATGHKTWPENFFRETYGAFADNPIERGDQGETSQREALR